MRFSLYVNLLLEEADLLTGRQVRVCGTAVPFEVGDCRPVMPAICLGNFQTVNRKNFGRVKACGQMPASPGRNTEYFFTSRAHAARRIAALWKFPAATLASLVLHKYIAAMDARKKLLDEIDAFLDRTGMTETTFGRHVGNDTALLFSLRRGRTVRIDTADKIRVFMREYQPAKAKKRKVAPKLPPRGKPRRQSQAVA